MANVGRLAIQLTAKTSRFQRKMASARVSVVNWASSVKNLLVGSFKLAIASGLAFGAVLTILANQQRPLLDRIGKFSKELGISTQAMATFRLMADLTGTSINVLDRGLQIFVRRLGEAQFGQGEARAGLKKLGLSAEALSRLPLDKALFRVMSRMQQLPSQAQKVGVAFTLFSRQGQDLINFLDTSLATFKDIEHFAKKVGFAQAAIRVEQVEKMNDALRLASAALEGLVRTFLTRLAPIVTLLAKRFNRWMAAGEGAAKKLDKKLIGLFDKIIEGINKVTSFFGGMIMKMAVPIAQITAFWLKGFFHIKKVIRETFAEFRIGIDRSIIDVIQLAAHAKTAFVDFQEMMNKISPVEAERRRTAIIQERQRKTSEAYKRIAARMKAVKFQDAIDEAAHTRMFDQIARFGTRLLNIGNDIQNARIGDRFRKDIQKIVNETLKFGKRQRNLEAISEELQRLRDMGIQLFDEVSTPLEKFKLELFELNRLFSTGVVGHEFYLRGLFKIRQDTIETTKTFFGLNQELKEMRGEFKQVSRSTSAVFNRMDTQRLEPIFTKIRNFVRDQQIAQFFGIDPLIRRQSALGRQIPFNPSPVGNIEEIRQTKVLERIERNTRNNPMMRLA